MNPWLRQLGRVLLTEVTQNTEGAKGSTTSRGVAYRGQPTPRVMLKKGKESEKRRDNETDDVRVAELRKRYKKVQNEPDVVARPKSPVDSDWF